MKPITEKIARKGILLSDGAWGTMLQSKGLSAGECPELWNVTHREGVFEIAKGYVDAGSDLVETNTFGGSTIRLAHFDLQDRTIELNRIGAEISRDAAADQALVTGSIGPSGVILMTGEVSEDELYESFSEQVSGLVAGGVDALLIETFTAIDEAVIAINAARENSELEIACTFTFDRTPTGEYRTVMGHTVDQVVQAITNAGADIVGTNCGNGISGMIDLVREIRTAEPNRPLLVQPNAGIPREKNGSVTWPDPPEKMASMIPELIEAGANIVGGCCGTTPGHIRAMRKVLDGMS